MTSAVKLIDQIDRALGGGSAPGRIGVAVSGGSDSLALLYLLHQWGRADLTAATVDHGLRPEAAAEAARVAEICAGLDVPHQTLEWGRWAGSGNLQSEARKARYALLAHWAQDQGRDAVCLAHTMDDQAETFLMRLAREAGVDGLSGMEPAFRRQGVAFLRPLLETRRSDLRSYLESRHVGWIDDPSNDDDAFDRIKARKALVALEPLGIDAARLSGTIGNLRSARQALDATAQAIVLKHCHEENGDLLFDESAFRERQSEIVRRIGVAAVRWIGETDYPPRKSAQFSEILPWARSGGTCTLRGCLLTANGGNRRITREFNAVKEISSRTDVLWDGRWCLDGPHAPDLELRALGEAVSDTDWRETRMPRVSLLSSPAVWRGEELVAAPVAGLANGWTASATGRGNFADFLLSR